MSQVSQIDFNEQLKRLEKVDEDKKREQEERKGKLVEKEKLMKDMTYEKLEITDLEHEKLYNLPELVPLQQTDILADQKQLEKFQVQTQSQQQIIDSIVNYLLENFRTFKVQPYMTNPQNKKVYFPFLLPSTVFKESLPPITFFQNQSLADERTKMEKLTKEQVNSILLTGRFEIPSQKYPIPYVWEINRFLCKGRVPALNQWFQLMSVAFTQIYNIPARFLLEPSYNQQFRDSFSVAQRGSKAEKNQNYQSRRCCCIMMFSYFTYALQGISLTRGLGHLTQVLPRIFSVTIGIPSLFYPSQSEVLSVLNIDRQIQLFQQNPNLNQEFFQYFCTDEFSKSVSYQQSKVIYITSEDGSRNIIMTEKPTAQQNVTNENQRAYDQKLILMQNLEEKFVKLWAKSEEELSKQYADLELKEYFWQMREEKLNLIEKLLRETKELPDRVAEHANFLIRAIDAIAWYENEAEEERVKLLKSKIQEIQKNHQIQSLNGKWTMAQAHKLAKDELFKINESYDSKIEEVLKKGKFSEASQMYRDFMQYFDRNHAKLLKNKGKEVEDQLKTPSRVYETQRHLFPPYQVELRNGYYYMEKYTTYFVNSSDWCWRLKLYAQRYYVWSINIAFFLFDAGWKSRFGLKALLWFSQFPSYHTINSGTGKVIESGMIQPYYVCLLGVWQTVIKKRAHFQHQPDTGIFGKNFSRIFNLFVCYVLIFLFIGVGIVGCLYPIGILINTLICFAMALTSFLWIPITLVFRILFHLLIFDFDNPVSRYTSKDSIKNIQYLNTQVVPLFSIANDIIFQSILQVVLSLFSGIIMHNVIAIFMTLLAAVNWLHIYIRDSIMIVLIKKLGRQPLTDSIIAVQISGFGLGRGYSMSMDGSDIQLFVMAELQRIILDEYRKRLMSLINKPREQAEHSSKVIFAPFNLGAITPNIISKNTNLLIDNLNIVINERLTRYPQFPCNKNVRFTESELGQYFPQTSDIVQNTVVNRQLDGFIWRYFQNDQLQEGDYKQLTKLIWKRIFSGGYDIFEPIEEAELRFSLKPAQKNLASISSINAAISGNPNSIKFIPNFAQQKSSIMKTDPCTFNGINQLLNFNTSFRSKSYMWNHLKQTHLSLLLDPFYYAPQSKLQKKESLIEKQNQ